MAALHLSWITLLKRNVVSVAFPVVAFGLIFADYSYTKACKARQSLVATKRDSEELRNVYE